MYDKNRLISRLQLMAFVIAVVAFLFLILFYMNMITINPKIIIPNLIATYGILIGIIGLLKGKNKNIHFFYITIAICIIVIVNMVWLGGN